MFGLGGQELIVILVIILFIFGAKRLPDIGAGLGKTMKEIRKIRDERKEEKEGKQEDKKGKDQDRDGSLLSDLKKEVEDIPGLKEAREIKKTADEVRKITRFTKFLK